MHARQCESSSPVTARKRKGEKGAGVQMSSAAAAKRVSRCRYGACRRQQERGSGERGTQKEPVCAGRCAGPG